MKLGIIGCGNIVDMHVRHIDRTPVKTVCVMDVDQGRRLRMAERLGCDCASDRAELLARSDVDAVLIASPNSDHAPSAIAALKAGKHVLCEKPVVRNLDEGQPVLLAARESKAVFQSAFMRRCHPAYQRLRELVRSAIGEIQNVRIRNTDAVPPENWLQCQSSAEWVNSSGGYLTISGCHSLDIMRWILGEPKSVLGKTRSWGGVPAEAYTSAAFDYGPFHAFWDYGLHRVRFTGDWRTSWEDKWEVLGEKARVSLSMPDWDRYDENRPILRVQWGDGRLEEWAMPPCDYYEMQLVKFAGNVAAGKAEPDLSDGLRAQALVAAIRESSRNGVSVPVSDFYSKID